jgi:hypothetical protein
MNKLFSRYRRTDMKKTVIMCVIAAVLSAAVIPGLAWAQTAGCTDSDSGRVYNVKGSANGANGRIDDKCVNPSQLNEAYCDGSAAKKALMTCARGCATGACRSPQATEVTAGQTTTTTSSAATSTTLAESTTTTTRLIGGDRDEHGCIGSAGYTWCESKQKCLRTFEEECEATTTTTTIRAGNSSCTDSDGGKNYNVGGTTQGVNGKWTDSCLARGRVREWLCEGDFAISTVYKCAKACKDGACWSSASSTATTTTQTTTTTIRETSTTLMAATTTVKAVTTASCSDSDNGKAYNVKGTTIGANGRKGDNCLGASIQEYYCDGTLAKMDLHKCSGGCFDGACREASSTSTTPTTLKTTTTTV